MESTCAKFRFAQFVSDGGAAVVATAAPPVATAPTPTPEFNPTATGDQFNGADLDMALLSERPNQR